FYAICSSFFLAVFLIKYRIEFLLTFPLFSLMFTWYLAIGLKPNSAAQAPERLFTERRFLMFVGFVCLSCTSWSSRSPCDERRSSSGRCITGRRGGDLRSRRHDHAARHFCRVSA